MKARRLNDISDKAAVTCCHCVLIYVVETEDFQTLRSLMKESLKPALFTNSEAVTPRIQYHLHLLC